LIAVENKQMPPHPVYLSDNLHDIIGKRLSDELRNEQPYIDIVHPEDQEASPSSLNNHQQARLPTPETSYRRHPSPPGSHRVPPGVEK